MLLFFELFSSHGVRDRITTDASFIMRFMIIIVDLIKTQWRVTAISLILLGILRLSS